MHSPFIALKTVDLRSLSGAGAKTGERIKVKGKRRKMDENNQVRILDKAAFGFSRSSNLISLYP